MKMVKKGDNLLRMSHRQESCEPGEFVEVLLEPNGTQKGINNKQADPERSQTVKYEQRGKCKTKSEICGTAMNLTTVSNAEENMETEYQHEKDLETLEQAIAQKRFEMRKQMDMDHMKEKAALRSRIENLEHARLTQQHSFGAAIAAKKESIERLKKEYERFAEYQRKKVEELCELEKNRTRNLVEELDSIQTKQDEIAPAIGRLDGKLQLIYMAAGESDNSIPKGMLEDLEQKYRDTEVHNAAEVQILEQFTVNQVDVLMDEITDLDQEMDDERRKLEESKEAHENKLGDLSALIQRGKRLGPVQFDEEKVKLQEEIQALKQYWTDLRGHIEDQIESILEHTEKKKFEGRDQLLKQRRGFYEERQKTADILREATAKAYEKQRELETATQLFHDRVKTKTAKLDEIEANHAECLRGRCERRDKRMKELECIEEEKAKRLRLEANLLDTKESQMKSGFEVKRTHLQSAIKQTEARVDKVMKEIRKPKEEDLEKVAKLKINLTEVEMKRDFLKSQEQFAQEATRKEIDLVHQEGKNFLKSYATQFALKQKEALSLRKVFEKLKVLGRRQLDMNREKYKKETAQLTHDVNKLQDYFDNLTTEVERLKAERLLMRDEYIKAQEGIQNAMLGDEESIEKEKENIHVELDQERENFKRSLQTLNAKMIEARRRRHEMTAKFKRDIGNFTAKAMGMGSGVVAGVSARANLLKTYEDEIKKYTFRMHAINEKLELMKKELADKKDQMSQQKLRELQGLQKEYENIEKVLLIKQQSIKEGNMLLQLFANEDNCLYCKNSNPSESQRDQLSKVHEENRKLTQKLTKLFKKEKEYDKVSSRQLEELRSTLETSMSLHAKHFKARNAGEQKPKRSASQSSTGGISVTSTSNE